MMQHCMKNITPDSLTGAIFAVEGIRDACVVLNGPTGCKLYHSAVSDGQYSRCLSFDPLEFAEEFYFGQPRIPATYLDGYDYVYGSGEKLIRVLKRISAKDYRLIAVINSPGAALIGDDLPQILKRTLLATPCFAIENTGYSGSFAEGYQNALDKIFEILPANSTQTVKKSVNLLGFHIYQKHFENNLKTIKKMLALCGIRVIASPCAGDTAEKITHRAEAELNVVVYPEYGERAAKQMQKQYGIPYIIPTQGAPIGFEAAENFILEVCKKLNAESSRALEELDKVRARAYLFLARYSSLLGLPKGALYSICADSSTAYALTKWLSTYLGMIPSAVAVTNGTEGIFAKKLRIFLKDIGYGEAMNNPITTSPAHIVFADGNTLAQMRLAGQRFGGVEISLPSLGYMDVMPKTFFGGEGALFLLEQILNGLRFLE